MKKVDENLAKERLGEKGNNKRGSTMTILKYDSSNDIIVSFENGNQVHTTYKNFLAGEVRNVYDKIFYGVGYMGEGKYNTTVNKKHTRYYKYWYSMMDRCYDEKFHEKRVTYKECVVCEEWHDFQNFALWYEENYYQIEGEKMCLDKDILVKGNKVYSPETCIFVPQKINNLFVKPFLKRNGLPIGVKMFKNKYMASCSNGTRKPVHLGSFTEIDDAFLAYKSFKEKYIKQVAEEYREKIPPKLYSTMINYAVEKTD